MSWTITPRFTQWTPALISTALWLDAADASTVTTVSGAVSQWSDKSGNARHAAQANAPLRPTYVLSSQNGKNTIAVDTLGQFLVNQSGGVLSGVSAGFMFVVGAIAGTSASTRIIAQVATSTNNTRLSIFRDPSEAVQTGGRRLPTESFQGAGEPASLGSSYNILGSVVSFTGTRLDLWKNGTNTASNTNFQTSGSTPNDAGNYAVFNGVLGDSNVFTGSIGELVVGHGVLTDPDRQKLEGYLAHKWGLTANLPANHPYKVNPPAP